MPKLRDAFALLSAAVLLSSLTLAGVLVQDRHARLMRSEGPAARWVEAVAATARALAAPVESSDPPLSSRTLPETVGQRILIPLAVGRAIDLPSAMAEGSERIWRTALSSVRGAAPLPPAPLSVTNSLVVSRR